MVKRSVLSFVMFSAIGGGFGLMLGTHAVARSLDNMEAEKLTYSALVSDSYHVSSHTAQASYLPEKSSRPAAKRAAVHRAAYHPKRRGAVVKRAVYHQIGSHLLSSLGRLRLG
ncbi:hypothetical protein FAI41_00940 [Acetobacteraceae bacterium]|nr:hypothetical protein FAI41_00940 [Acetobacteraceae bacterium]